MIPVVPSIFIPILLLPNVAIPDNVEFPIIVRELADAVPPPVRLVALLADPAVPADNADDAEVALPSRDPTNLVAVTTPVEKIFPEVTTPSVLMPVVTYN